MISSIKRKLDNESSDLGTISSVISDSYDEKIVQSNKASQLNVKRARTNHLVIKRRNNQVKNKQLNKLSRLVFENGAEHNGERTMRENGLPTSVVHATAATDDKKLQSCLKKLSVNTIPGIEEVNMIKDDGTVIHFNNPKAQASLNANTFAITGHGENKQITEMLPGILSQLGPEGLTQLKRLASTVAGSAVGKATMEEDDEVPDLVENFDEASKEEVVTKKEVEETDKNAVDKKEIITPVEEKKEAIVKSDA
ncbi:hypothetical protein G9C98_004406 [Cotesia typhae]|uniref:Transcription factor BTF3 n=1 Tax=Cotesia typhae TaxID=2053667 RepID=A0A8J5V7Q3_9HYME|nr:hypothetical protein G9C98_004406 [Cotesia typhae]